MKNKSYGLRGSIGLHIASVKNQYRIGKGFTDTCNCALMWLSLYYFNTLAESSKKKGEETSKLKIEI